jgi:dephospho-CoA kinase
MRRRVAVRRVPVIAVTGSYGSGKSTVARMLRCAGTRLIDADKLAHTLMRPGTATTRRIARAFGEGVLDRDNGIDRAALAELVFCDKRLLKRLCSIVHPAVIRMIKRMIKASKAGRAVILDAPLLIESGLRERADVLIVVKARRNDQIDRVHRKTGLKKSDIKKRIDSQIPLSEKVRMADFVIDNSGSLKETERQVRQIRGKMDLSRAVR